MGNLQVFDCYSINIGWNANLEARGERAGKTAQSTYCSCHDAIITQILDHGQSCEVEMAGFCCYNWPNSNHPGFGVVNPMAMVLFWVGTAAATDLGIWNSW